jgi:hypothetical protein
MILTLRAGAFALAMTVLLPALPAHATSFGFAGKRTASIDLIRLKSMLRLTPEQQPYWAPVEAALRDVVGRQKLEGESARLVRNVGNKVLSVVLDNATIQRLATAARPLIARLDMRQMQMASGMAQEMGLGPVVAALQ